MTNKEIRYANLVLLLKRFDTKREFADRCNLSPGHVSQLYNKTRDIGDKVAEKIENGLSLERGWMDSQHNQDTPAPQVNEVQSEYNLEGLMAVATPRSHAVLERIQKAFNNGKLTEEDMQALDAIAQRFEK